MLAPYFRASWGGDREKVSQKRKIKGKIIIDHLANDDLNVADTPSHPARCVPIN